MALCDNPIIQRAAVSRALKAEGYSAERIAEMLAAIPNRAASADGFCDFEMRRRRLPINEHSTLNHRQQGTGNGR